MAHSIIAKQLVLSDTVGLPRYWPAVWTIFHGSELARSTLTGNLRHIDALYAHADSLGVNLDDAMANLDLPVLHEVLGSFFAVLRNVPHPTENSNKRWDIAYSFVGKTIEKLRFAPSLGGVFQDAGQKILALDNLYMGLRPHGKLQGRPIRAIPRAVLAELFEAATPGSATNPFVRLDTQWRVYCLFVLYLFQGLRRAEPLLLQADFLATEREVSTGERRWRMSVKTANDLEDLRASLPSIKTPLSFRTLPVTQTTANVLVTYSENYRGRVKHGFFMSSARGLPLSIEGVSKAMQKLSSTLSPESRSELQSLTGTENIQVHALRHTCAVARYRQWTKAGVPTDRAMENMRTFFGWAKNSQMPLLYAKAALDEALNESWLEIFDGRVELLRSLPR